MATLRDMRTNQQGFTLLEVLIVVAIIGVLTSVAIPVFNGGFEKAKQQTDRANMDAAYAAATTEWLAMTDPDEVGRFFYTGSGLTTLNIGLEGYGQSDVDASSFASDFPVPVSGVPNKDGKAQFITVLMDSEGVKKLYWGNSSYSGPIVNNANDYLTIDNDVKMVSDIELFDSLQNQLRSMTYGEILDIMTKHKVRQYSWSGNVCYWIATSAIDLDTGEIRLDANKIYTPELFEAVGFDTNADADKMYLFGSVPNSPNNRSDYKVYFYIDLLVPYSYAKEHRDELAVKAITYENDDGSGKHDLSHKNRV